MVRMVTNSPANAGDLRGAGWSSGLRRSPGEGNGNPLRYFLENPVDRGTWWATVHGDAESDRTEATWHTAHMHIYMGFLGGGSGKEPACQCRRHKRCRLEPWVGRSLEECRQLTPVFLPGGSHGHRSLWAIVHRVTKSWTQLRDLVCLLTYVYVYYDSEKREKIASYFSVLKSFMYILCSPSLFCECLDLLILVGLCR